MNKIRLVIVLVLTTWMLGLAATLTIDIPGSPSDPNSAVSRVAVSYGQMLQLGRRATMQEVSDYTQSQIINLTKAQERQTYINNYVEIPLMTPTPTATPTPGGFKSAPLPTTTPKKKK